MTRLRIWLGNTEEAARHVDLAIAGAPPKTKGPTHDAQALVAVPDVRTAQLIVARAEDGIPPT
ncbi:hypothetical protein FOMPIDRAFT_1055732 [Fomitopsis schrenkii]|uniref:Uncharacterized protein n=1 Tax=Fomitopsis schrenkii TaxID=2126942 RepID=S8DJI3_FOMSC|nr:hypothetical protein FOMPIDRAFT_1055732 [Fomitopsis schrenkii]